jgi:hypothetical protein
MRNNKENLLRQAADVLFELYEGLSVFVEEHVLALVVYHGLPFVASERQV